MSDAARKAIKRIFKAVEYLARKDRTSHGSFYGSWSSKKISAHCQVTCLHGKERIRWMCGDYRSSKKEIEDTAIRGLGEYPSASQIGALEGEADRLEQLVSGR